MRILTVRQPWAGAIIHQGKDVENRSRSLAGEYRGLVAIHVAQRHDYSAVDALIQRTGHIGPENTYGHGAIIGVVNLVDVHKVTILGCPALGDICSQWADMDEGSHHILLANPRPLSEPIPYKGGLGLRRLPDSVAAQVIEALS